MAQRGTINVEITGDHEQVKSLVVNARRRYRIQQIRDLAVASVTAFCLGALGMGRLLRHR